MFITELVGRRESWVTVKPLSLFCLGGLSYESCPWAARTSKRWSIQDIKGEPGKVSELCLSVCLSLPTWNVCMFLGSKKNKVFIFFVFHWTRFVSIDFGVWLTVFCPSRGCRFWTFGITSCSSTFKTSLTWSASKRREAKSKTAKPWTGWSQSGRWDDCTNKPPIVHL